MSDTTRPQTLAELHQKRIDEARKFGRIDKEGKVFVSLGKAAADGEKFVGQYMTGETDESMALYVNRFVDNLEKLEMFEKRLEDHDISLPTPEIDNTVNNFKSFLEMKNAVGDFQMFQSRLEALPPKCEERKAWNHQHRQEQIQEALKTLAKCVTAVEAELNNGLEKVNWKKAGDVLEGSLTKWQEVRKTVFLPDGPTNEMWNRLKAARDTIYSGRREFNDKFKKTAEDVKRRKQLIIDEAEKLKGSENFDSARKEFTRLMNNWKKIKTEVGIGRKKDDDKQWEKFKAAQDHFYARLPKLSDEEKASRKEKSKPAKWDNDTKPLSNSIASQLGDLSALEALKKQLS